MRKFLCCVVITALSLSSLAQQTSTRKPSSSVASPKKEKKYPSLLWEITGKGLKKPSYLFGTMHVSDKLAFHLGDSFYNAIKSVDVVALETNPETWQEDFSKSTFLGKRNNRSSYAYDEYDFNELMNIGTFAIDEYEEAIKAALAAEPAMINGMLYRTLGNNLDDFEENTFLDMYIFQVGKKLKKKLTGVEDFAASEKLVAEAYRDMMKDMNKKRKSNDYEGMAGGPKKIEDAYRKGDLDLLDSLENLTVMSAAFQEKFLYKRNEIQASSIDTIIRKQSLFVGVGAAHLPGKRGVIEMLRDMGYTLRPVMMDARSSKQKEAIDNIRGQLSFRSQSAQDGFYSVNIPGDKFYRFTEWKGIDVVQFTDLINGAYYVVSRIKTNALSLGHSAETVQKKIDSMLYENIPGKILTKTKITKNGYPGFEISNRTRRGDVQRFNILITPFEVLIFKMSGNSEYVNAGDEAKQFFGSIRLKEAKSQEWSAYKHPYGAFNVQMPGTPIMLKDDNFGRNRFEYAAVDKTTGNDFLIFQSSIHNYNFIEEDTFELNLMDESYAFSPFIDKKISSRFTRQTGYPAMEAKYKHKDGSFSTARFILRGPVYYALIAHYKKEDESVNKFLTSFDITPYAYGETKSYSDSAMKFSVRSPVIPITDKSDLMKELEEMYQYSYLDDDDIPAKDDGSAKSSFKWISNDSTGEKIFMFYASAGQYVYEKDSVEFWKKYDEHFYSDSDFVIRTDKRYTINNNIKCREIHLSDTGSSKMMMTKLFYKDGHLFSLLTLTDTLAKQSSFIEQFFGTLKPADSLKYINVFNRKSKQFFDDYFSTDTLLARKSRRNMSEITFDSLDVPLLKTAITRLNWGHKNYLDHKKSFIFRLSYLNDASITPFLRDLYLKVGDTAVLQNAVLYGLTNQKTKEAYAAFKDIMISEPPVYSNETDYDGQMSRWNTNSSYDRSYVSDVVVARNYRNSRNYRWSNFSDSLSLTKTMFPDLLQLMNVDDYEDDVLSLLTLLVDSGFIKGLEYESYFSKIFLDAKQELKKQIAKEDKASLEKVSRKDEKKSAYSQADEDEEMNEGNNDLDNYAVLLMPFYDKNANVKTFFDQLMKTKDKELLYNTSLLMLRNKKQISDTVLIYFAKSDDYRTQLYDDLKQVKLLDKFPATHKTQLDFTRAMLKSSFSDYNQLDTLVFLEKLPATYKAKKGYVYFYKYKQMKDDEVWHIAAIGLQPENQNEVNTDDSELMDLSGTTLDNEQPVDEQLRNKLKEMLISKHPAAAGFYEARSYRNYKNYLSDAVKTRRYRD